MRCSSKVSPISPTCAAAAWVAPISLWAPITTCRAIFDPSGEKRGRSATPDTVVRSVT